MALDTSVAQINAQPVDFIRKKSGEIVPCLANVSTLLRNNPLSWDLGYDDFSHRMYKGDEVLEDQHFLEITEWVQHQGILSGTDIVAAACQRIARERQFHQVKDYLETLVWDDIDRLPTMLSEYAGAPNLQLTRVQSQKWMIQAVARVYEPGCQADATLIFEGDQGVGKSTFFRTLFGPKWFTDHLPDITNKDALLQLRGVWCVEIAELATFTKADAKRINQFLTSRTDRYRDPYGRLVSDYPRQNVFAGTVNPGANGYLKDETGARRFWSVETRNETKIDLLSQHRDLLWAEAVAKYKAGEKWHLNSKEDVKLAAQSQKERFTHDPWLGAITSFVTQKDRTTIDDVFIDCLNMTAKSDWSPQDMSRIAGCLSHLGWERYRQSADAKGERPYGYRPCPNGTEAQSHLILNEVGQESDNEFNDIW